MNILARLFARPASPDHVAIACRANSYELPRLMRECDARLVHVEGRRDAVEWMAEASALLEIGARTLERRE